MRGEMNKTLFLSSRKSAWVEEISNWCVTQVAVATCSEREQVIVLGGEECENQLQRRGAAGAEFELPGWGEGAFQRHKHGTEAWLPGVFSEPWRANCVDPSLRRAAGGEEVGRRCGAGYAITLKTLRQH